MISIVTVGRDDNYGRQFIDRFYFSLSNTLKVFDDLKLEYELLVVDWAPINEKYLHQNEKLKKIFQHDKVKSIIVSPDTILNEKLSPDNFYELFAKNAGVRRSNYDWLLILNSDILITKNLIVETLKQKEKVSTSDKLFFRYSNRIALDISQVSNDQWKSLKPLYLVKPSNWDDHVLGAFSGDIIFISKNVFCNIGTGYNEFYEENKHPSLRQGGMDSEFLYNLDKKNAKMVRVDNPYGHINHRYDFTRIRKKRDYINWNGYENPTDWGMAKYSIKLFANKNIFII